MDEATTLRNQHLSSLSQLSRLEGQGMALDRGMALIAAHEQPWIDPDDLVLDLDRLIDGLHVPEDCGPIEQVARLNHHIFQTLGFTGEEDDYDAPTNSMLDRVLERRRGLPILLSAIYMEVARRVAVAIDGVGFPGHFVVRPRDSEEPFFVDAFRRGRIHRWDEMLLQLARFMDRPLQQIPSPEKYLEPVSSREILGRMNRNLKFSYLRRKDAEGALRAVDRLLVIEPGLATERRDRGLLLLELQRPDKALPELRRYLHEHPDGEDFVAMEQLLAELDADN